MLSILRVILLLCIGAVCGIMIYKHKSNIVNAIKGAKEGWNKK